MEWKTLVGPPILNRLQVRHWTNVGKHFPRYKNSLYVGNNTLIRVKAELQKASMSIQNQNHLGKERQC